MKKIRYLFVAIVALLIYTVFISSTVRNIFLSNQESRFPLITEPIKYLSELPSMIKKATNKPEFMVRNNKLKGNVEFVTQSTTNNYPNLLTTYKDEAFGQKFELFDINKNKSIKVWAPNNQKLYNLGYNEEFPKHPPKGSDLHFMHPIMLKDSSLIFNAQLTSLLARTDKENNIVWTKNDRRYHHSIEMDHEGKIYSCTRPFVSGKYDFLPGNHEAYKNILSDDEIAKIDPENGKILFRKSIIQILLDNGYENILIGKGQMISDMIHLNDIQPALNDSEYWKKGDLLISCRNICTVFLYRPSTNKILWLKNEPWYNQHDADFLENDKIVVFGNNIFREESTLDPPLTSKKLFFNGNRKNNEIYVYDFSKDSVYTPYSKLMEVEKVRTLSSGRCDILPNGDIFIEETNSGRIIFGDSVQKKIEFGKRIDDEHISSLFWSRLMN